MGTEQDTTAWNCPGCDGEIPPTSPVVQNEIVECPECRLELEVVSAEPLMLAIAPEVEEDWGE